MNGTASTIAAARHDQHSPAGLHKGAKGGLIPASPALTSVFQPSENSLQLCRSIGFIGRLHALDHLLTLY